MKNKTPLIVVGVIVILAVGAFFFMRQNGTLPTSMTGDSSDMFSNAMMGTGSVMCEYTDSEGQMVKAYVKNGKVRSDMTGGAQGDMSFLMMDKTMYSWNMSTKEGFKYQVPDVTTAPDDGTGQDTPSQDQAAEFQKDLEQYKQSCKNGSVSDSLFEVPSDVTFTDYSEMMKGTMQQIPQQYQQYLPQQ